MEDKVSNTRRIWIDIEDDVNNSKKQYVTYDSYDPETKKNAGLLDVLLAWQLLNKVLIDSIETSGNGDPENLVGKLKHCHDVVFGANANNDICKSKKQ